MLAKKNEKNKSDIRSRALNLLSYRARSVQELSIALRDREFEEPLINETLSWLIELGYLNDETFATELASSRRRNKNWGRRKIAFDLNKRGISGDIISTILDGFSEEEEESVAKDALGQWIKKRGAALPLEKKLFESAFRHLQIRGFPSAIIYRVLKSLTPQSNDDFY